jgi:uridine kinase
MVIESPEADNLFWLSISMGDSLKIYVVPIIYLLLLYSAWRIRRMNYDLLMATLGVAFSIVILLSPSPPGWYVWLLPIYSLHQSRNKNASLLVALFSIVFIFYHLMNSSGSAIVGINYYPVQLFQEWTLGLDSKFQSSIYSLMLGLAGLISLQILRDGIRGNDSYRLGRKPFVIGVAGFYSSGKDIFNNSLANLFGKRSAIEICGKDYYHWDQSSPMWKTVTHYNPKSSRLFDMTNDLRELLLGGEIKARSYDSDGYYPMAIRKNHTIVLVNSMYALFSRKLIQMQDIHFFLEIDEKLDNYLQLKVGKSTGYSQSLKIINDIGKNASDIKAFIEPQKETADVIFSIDYINSDLLDASYKSSNLRLKVTIQDGMYYQKMMKVLIGICGLEFKVNRLNNDGKVELEIYGDVKAGDLHLSSGVLIPNLIELIDGEKGFKDGVFGLMQLIALMEINERIAKRIESRE